MSGLQRLFLRITPIIMLICFICFGISHTFETEQTGSITYLSKETITLNDNATPENTTDDLTIEQYKFDTKSYVENIDQNILKRSIDKTFDLDAYTNTLMKFNTIWEDGYNIGDVSMTIANAIMLVINTIITPINIILVPIRITAGILLTAFSLVGINVNNNTGLIKALNGILDKLNIPMIDVTGSKDRDTSLQNTTWQFNNNLTNITYSKIGIINFTTNQQHYTGIITKKTNNNTEMWYIKTYIMDINTNPNPLIDTKVYDTSQGGWQNQTYRTITFESYTQQDAANRMKALLEYNAIQQPNELHDSVWQFNNTITNINNNFESGQRVNGIFGSNGQNFIAIEVVTGNNPSLKYHWLDSNNQDQTAFMYTNGAWINQNYRTIQIEDENLTDQQITDWLLILTLLATRIQ